MQVVYALSENCFTVEQNRVTFPPMAGQAMLTKLKSNSEGSVGRPALEQWTQKKWARTTRCPYQAGLLSCKSFNQKNHSADNTLSPRLLPTKNARHLPWAVFLLAS